MIIDSHVILDTSVDEVLRRMDAAGVGRAVLAASPEGAILCRSGAAAGGNEEVRKAVLAHPDRLIGCAYMNPLDADAAKRVEEWAGEGFKAVKLHPSDGWSPDDKALYPFYEKVEAARLAAVFHMGLADHAFDTAHGRRRAPDSACAYPMRLDPVCRLFPAINFLVLNMGYPLFMEAWSVHHNAGNIFLHIGGEGVQFSSLATAYAALGGPAFIPLDFNRVVFGACDAPDMLRARLLAEDSAARMGCCPHGRDSGVFGANAEALYRL